MSHWQTRKTTIRNLDDLEAAAKELGMKMVRAKAGDRVKADAGFGVMSGDATLTDQSGHYPITINKHQDGTYSLSADWYVGTANIVGKNFNKLLQLYGVHACTRAARQKGYLVQRKVTGSNINLIVTKP